MILKILAQNGAVSYMSAEEFLVNKIFVEGIFENFLPDSQGIQDPGYWAQRHNFLVSHIQQKTGMDSRIIDFKIDREFEKLDLICCIMPTSKGREQDIIVTNQTTFLMSDEGKTIDRLI